MQKISLLDQAFLFFKMNIWREDEGESLSYCMKRIFDRRLTTLSGGNLSIKKGEKIYITPKVFIKIKYYF